MTISRSRIARRLATILATAILTALAYVSTASADLSACLEDQVGVPLRRVYIKTLFAEYLTDDQGCITLPEDPFFGFDYIEVDVHRQNPVVRVDNAAGLPPFITAKARLRDGETVTVDMSHGSGEDAHMSIANSLLDAYNHGLREFSPWQSEFAAAEERDARELLRVVYPSAYIVGLPFVEPSGVTNKFPALHLDTEYADNHRVHAHELGHMLHFSQLTEELRSEAQDGYLLFLIFDEDKFHLPGKTTNPLIAWIEAFGCFAATYESTFADAPTASGPARHEFYFERVERLLERDDSTCGRGGLDPSYRGEDVEGAIMLALFYQFARDPNVGLDLAVETFISSQALNVADYGVYMRDRFGASSAVYEALYAAGARYGLDFREYTGPVHGRSETADHFGQTSASGDFNGDGYMDLVVGSPDETVSDATGAGAINVFYGSYWGLMEAKNQVFTSESPGMLEPTTSSYVSKLYAGRAGQNENFAEALAAGDFDGDGYDDLAIGVPGQTVAGRSRAGYVLVMYGSFFGLSTAGVQDFHQNSPGIADSAETSDLFGRSLAVGDWNGDERDDLAIGVPYEDITGNLGTTKVALANAGVVHALYGSDSGLSSAGSQLWSQASSGMRDTAEAYDYFGWSLASGNFDGDTVNFGSVPVDDLAIGVPYEDIGSVRDAGAVSVIYGLAGSGLRSFGNQVWHQDTPGIWSVNEAYDRYGYSLVTGNFDGDAWVDLAVGIPFEDIGGIRDAGAVNVIYGASAGLSTSGDFGFSRDTSGVEGSAVANDRFGFSLAAANFNGDRIGGRSIDDLAVGVPLDHVGSEADGGSVNVLYGRTSGLSASGDAMFSQNTAGIADSSENGDHFGHSLAGGDFNADGYEELAIGAPDETRGVLYSTGVVHVLRGLPSGLLGWVSEYWHQDR